MMKKSGSSGTLKIKPPTKSGVGRYSSRVTQQSVSVMRKWDEADSGTSSMSAQSNGGGGLPVPKKAGVKKGLSQVSSLNVVGAVKGLEDDAVPDAIKEEE
jgi:hypothetical protein